MVNRSHRFAVLILALLFPASALAAGSLSITKVVADVPGANAGHQYIEVTNTGSDPIDLGGKTIRLVDHSGKHLIKSYGDASTILAPGGEVVIAQNPATFLSDNPSYSGALLKSSFSLALTGTVQIFDTSDETALAVKSYASAPIAKKPSATKASSTKQQKHYSSQKSYDKGIAAPSATVGTVADGASFGSLPVPPNVLTFIDALVSSVWFAVFLSLLAFSGFSLMVIEKCQETAFI